MSPASRWTRATRRRRERHSPRRVRIDVVYYLVHGIGQPDFRDTDNRAAGNVAAAAKDCQASDASCTSADSCPDDDELSEHLTSRAEVAHALSIEGGPEVVWLGAAMIIGSGSTSFEMLRYVSDRFVVIPMPQWVDNPMDPISVRDVLYYLVAAADPDRVPAGAYDIFGPETTTYRDLLVAYVRATGKWRAGLPIAGWTPAYSRGLPRSRCRCRAGWPPIWLSRSTIRWWPPATVCVASCPTRRAACSPSTTPSPARRRAAGPGRSTHWPTRTTSPTPTRPGPGATRCGSSGWPVRSHRPSPARRSVFSAWCPARSPARYEPDWTR